MSTGSASPLLNVSSIERALSGARVGERVGHVTRASGLILEAVVPDAALGSAWTVKRAEGDLVCECVGFQADRALLMPLDDHAGVRAHAPVVACRDGLDVGVGDGLLGRVLDGRLRPLDGRGRVVSTARAPLWAKAPPALTRRRIKETFATRVRAIDALLTCGEGQRIGIMAGAGVGKSVLLGMLARHCEADAVVLALVGERGREVREFIERDLGDEGRRRSAVVVATSDEPPLMRVHAALAATAIAEEMRSRGKRVLLLMDSLTRVAMAWREIGLSAEEPPTSKGYPPSVFSLLPRLVERAGNDAGAGSVTAMYTVLVEGDDLADPVADCARAALDGHFVLSRTLAGGGHFPAIDILQSVSRVFTDIVTGRDAGMARDARDLLSALKESADLVDVGAYVAGKNARVDRALTKRDALSRFLQQSPHESASLEQTRAALGAVLGTPASA